jgi:hypothetical protein
VHCHRNSDKLDLNVQTLTEVKNVGKQSLTRQLKDYLAFSQMNELKFELYMRGPLHPDGETTLTGPLWDAVKAGSINLKLIPGTF